MLLKLKKNVLLKFCQCLSVYGLGYLISQHATLLLRDTNIHHVHLQKMYISDLNVELVQCQRTK